MCIVASVLSDIDLKGEISLDMSVHAYENRVGSFKLIRDGTTSIDAAECFGDSLGGKK